MISNEEVNVLNETCRNTRMAVDAVDIIMNKIYDEDLGYDLNCQANAYREICRKAERALIREGIMPKQSSKIEKAMLWSLIQAGTILNTSTSHVADIIIRGNTRGITELMKSAHNNKKKGSYANELANELMNYEEKAIERLKSYL